MDVAFKERFDEWQLFYVIYKKTYFNDFIQIIIH